LGTCYPGNQNIEEVKQTCSTPSDVKKIKHALVIPYKYTRAHVEMLLAFHYDLQSRQPAESGVEGTGGDVVDIISPSQEGKGKRCTKT
jgi:hypothetical protein